MVLKVSSCGEKWFQIQFMSKLEKLVEVFFSSKIPLKAINWGREERYLASSYWEFEFENRINSELKCLTNVFRPLQPQRKDLSWYFFKNKTPLQIEFFLLELNIKYKTYKLRKWGFWKIVYVETNGTFSHLSANWISMQPFKSTILLSTTPLKVQNCWLRTFLKRSGRQLLSSMVLKAVKNAKWHLFKELSNCQHLDAEEKRTNFQFITSTQVKSIELRLRWKKTSQ